MKIKKSIRKYKFKSKKNLHSGGFFKIINPKKIKEEMGSEEIVWYENVAKCESKEEMCYGRKNGEKIKDARERIEYTDYPSEKSSNRFFSIIIDNYSVIKNEANISVNEEEPIELKKGFFENELSELNHSTIDGNYDIYYVFLNKKSKTGGYRWELKKIKNVQIKRIIKGQKLNGFEIIQNNNTLMLEIIDDDKFNMEWNISKFKVKGVIKFGTFWLNKQINSGGMIYPNKKKKTNYRYKKKRCNTKKLK